MKRVHKLLTLCGTTNVLMPLRRPACGCRGSLVSSFQPSRLCAECFLANIRAAQGGDAA